MEHYWYNVEEYALISKYEIKFMFLLKHIYLRQKYRPRNTVILFKRIKINILRWAGHVIRRKIVEIIKRIMFVKPEGKRKKSRPRMR
jgi:hypothetical protein